MGAEAHTVRGRVDTVRVQLSPAQVAVGLGVLALLGLTLVAVQEPAVHNALHDFRHVAGVTCH
jgi:cobalt transporter subunit CbtB